MSGYSTNKFQGGTTLVEVLVSAVVTSVGLLGVAGLMATTARINQEAYQRVQVDLAVQALVESMHVNMAAVTQGRYDGTLRKRTYTGVDCRKHACSASSRADDDLAQFDRTIENALPAVQASLKCDPALGTDGVICRIEIGWSDRSLAKGGEQSPQSSVWVFRP